MSKVSLLSQSMRNDPADEAAWVQVVSLQKESC